MTAQIRVRIAPYLSFLLLSVLGCMAMPARAEAVVPPNQAPSSAVGMATLPNGSNIVVYRGQDTAVYTRTFSPGSWSSESSLGGLIVGAPAVAAGGNIVIVVARGLDNSLWYRISISGVWGSWLSLGGNLSSSPATAIRSDGRIDVFARGVDNALWSRSRSPSGVWTGWFSLGGGLASGPAAVAIGTSVEIFVAGLDHAVWRRTSAGWSTLGGLLYSSPAAVRFGSSTHIFVRGRNNSVWTRTTTVGWSSIGGQIIDSPAATSVSTGIHIAVRGQDNALATNRLVNGSWVGFAATWTPSAPLPPGSSLFGTDWTTLNTGDRVIALTFDAGANAAGLPSIRSTLERMNVPATFFLTGDWTRSFPIQADEIAVAGYRIGNHSNTHPSFPSLTDAQINAQLTTAQQTILRQTGQDPRWLFRFPFGAVDSRVLSVVSGNNYVAVRWTVDSLGWQGTSGGQSVSSVVNRVLASARPGGIVLMHIGSNPADGTTLDAAALPQIISGFRARGYSFVTLDKLTG